VKRGENGYQVVMDGQLLADGMIPLQDDGVNHQVEVWLAE
jgi:hypothetical protein